MLSGFKKFIVRGSVVDLAIGVVIGAAFNTVVQSLVKDLITPLIAAIVHTPSFATMTFAVRGSVFAIGDFISALISFVIVAAAAYFLVVVPVNALLSRMKKGESVDPTDKTCPECLSKIPLAAKRCAFCTMAQAE